MYLDVYESQESRIIIEMDKTTAWGFIQRVADVLDLSQEQLDELYAELFEGII